MFIMFIPVYSLQNMPVFFIHVVAMLAWKSQADVWLGWVFLVHFSSVPSLD
jgi:hypothetical protein